MIWESWPWKQALLRDASKLEGLLLREEDEDAVVEFERAIFLAGFTIRKLIEAKKLTDRTAFADVKCWKLPLLDPARIPDRMNWHRLDEFYNLEDRRSATVKLSFLTNQLIHSFIFTAAIDENSHAEGVFVTTDYDRSKFLYQYDLAELVRIMRLVGSDDVQKSHWERDEKGDWTIFNYGSDRPAVK